MRQRSLTIPVAYGRADVEQAANSLNLSLSEEELDTILADVDSEVAELAVTATRSALASRIYDDLARVARGHAWSDDD